MDRQPSTLPGAGMNNYEIQPWVSRVTEHLLFWVPTLRVCQCSQLEQPALWGSLPSMEHFESWVPNSYTMSDQPPFLLTISP